MGNEGVRLADELMSVNAAMRRLVRRRLRQQKPPKLRPAQVELMAVVGARPGIGVAGAARELHLADNSVSTLVNQLLAAGMLRRDTDPDDRRAVRLQLTPYAHRRMADWRDRRARMVGAHIAELAEEDQAAIAAVLPALGRLLTSLQDQRSEDISRPKTPGENA
ncbi:MarR family transcriptional regulator [Actinoallomurus acaciae]|uniref:MarR family transcriptional regulator n=1 Tax=Actinoallomurus acaciae TaxID=502577 RepID=A0ABV5Y749_9ACTN